MSDHDYSKHWDVSQLWSLWSRLGCGPWELEAHGTLERVQVMEMDFHAVESPREFLQCFPGECPALLKKAGE